MYLVDQDIPFDSFLANEHVYPRYVFGHFSVIRCRKYEQSSVAVNRTWDVPLSTEGPVVWERGDKIPVGRYEEIASGLAWRPAQHEHFTQG